MHFCPSLKLADSALAPPILSRVQRLNLIEFGTVNIQENFEFRIPFRFA